MRPRILARRLRIGGAIALVLALLAMCGWLFAVNWRPAVSAFPVQGVDVSEAQGPIDWWAVKAGGEVRFAYVRATIGADRRDPRFAANWRALYETGIRRGAIHVFSLCQLAADQAGNLVRAVPRSANLLPAALELQFDPACRARPERHVVLGEIQRFIVAVEAYMGQRVMLKISAPFEAHYRVGAAVARPLWSVQPFFPPAYFDKPWSMWQASDFRRIAGVAGPVNWDVMAR